MIEDDEVEKALDWLRDNANEIGTAKERLVKAGHMVKHIKALQMQRWNGMTVSAQEREAVASPEYLEALLEEAKAAGQYEIMKSLREAAALKIEVWRSASANYRAMKI